jgi:membrane protease subunit HflK
VNDALRLRDEQTQVNLASEVSSAAQARLSAVRSGLVLSGVEFKEIHPPRHLRAEFERAQGARVEKETRRREAEGFAASLVPQAEAERNRLIKEAMAFQSSLQAQATAEVSAYRPVLDEYQKNPPLVRERLYREALEQVMAQIGRRYLVPAQAKSGDVRIFVSESENSP